jgi:hypothetical protein
MTSSTPGIADAWVVYDRAPAMFPGLAYTADGILLASFSTVADGLPGGEVHLIRSRDHGRTWSEPLAIARSRHPNGAALNAIGLTALRDGKLLLPWNDITVAAGYDSRLATLHIPHSDDDGRTWDGVDRVAPDIHEPFTYGRIIERDDGTLVCPIWGRWKAEERWRAAAIFSRDGGATWTEPTTIAYDPAAHLGGDYAHSVVSGFDASGNFDPAAMTKPTFRPHGTIDGFNETSIIGLNDGRLLAILRQQGVAQDSTLWFYHSTSSDGGRTWSPYARTNRCGMSPCLHRSPAGRLLLAYRRCAPDGQADSAPGVSIAESHDDGATWHELLTLCEPKGTRYTGEYQVGYPAMVNTPDGAILVVYYSYDESLPHRRYLAANLLRER